MKSKKNKFSKKGRKITKKITGGAGNNRNDPYDEYDPIHPSCYPLRKTKLDVNVDEDKKIKFLIGHGVTLPMNGEYQFDLKEGYNVIYVTEPLKFFLFGGKLRNYEILLGNLLSKYDFDLSKIYDLTEYINIQRNQDSKNILINDYLNPEFKKFINNYNELLLEVLFQDMDKFEDIKNNVNYEAFKRERDKVRYMNISSNMIFNLHIGGVNKKCNNVRINLSQNENNKRTGNYFCGMLEKIEDDSDFSNNLTNKNETKFLSQFMEDNGKGTYVVMCCRLNTPNNLLSKEENITMRVLSGQPEVFFYNPVIWITYCQLKDCYERSMKYDDPNFSLCNFCNTNFCKEHYDPIKHNCTNKCLLCDDINITKIMCFIEGCQERVCSNHYKDHIKTHVDIEATDSYLINLMAETFNIISLNIKKISTNFVHYQSFENLRNKDKLNILQAELNDIYFKILEMNILEGYTLEDEKKGFIFLLHMNDICKIREEIEKIGITL